VLLINFNIMKMEVFQILFIILQITKNVTNQNDLKFDCIYSEPIDCLFGVTLKLHFLLAWMIHKLGGQYFFRKQIYLFG